MIKIARLGCLVFVALTLSLSAQPLGRIKDRLHDRAEVVNGPIVRSIAKEILAGIAFYPDEIIVAIFEVCQDMRSLTGEAQPTSTEWKAAHAYLSRYPSVLENLRSHPLSSAATGRIARQNPDEAWKMIDEIRQDSGQTLVKVTSPSTQPSPSAPLFVPYPAPWVAAPTTLVQPPPVHVTLTSGSTTTTATTTASGATAAPTTAPAATVTTGTVTTASGAQGHYATATTSTGAGVATAVAGDQAAHAGASGVRQLSDGTVQTGSVGATVVATPYGDAVVGHAGTSSVNTAEGQASSTQAAGVATSTGRGAVGARQGETQWGANSYQHAGSGTVQTAQNGGATYTHDASGSLTETGATKGTSTTVTNNSGQTATVDRDVSVTQDTAGAPAVDRGGSVSTGSGQSYSWSNAGSPASSAPNPAAKKSTKQASAPPSSYTRKAPASSGAYSMSQMNPQTFDSAMRTATRQNSETFAKQERSLQGGGAGQGSRDTSGRPSPSAKNKREGGHRSR